MRRSYLLNLRRELAALKAWHESAFDCRDIFLPGIIQGEYINGCGGRENLLRLNRFAWGWHGFRGNQHGIDFLNGASEVLPGGLKEQLR
jgi:hypothetical protein